MIFVEEGMTGYLHIHHIVEVREEAEDVASLAAIAISMTGVQIITIEETTVVTSMTDAVNRARKETIVDLIEKIQREDSAMGHQEVITMTGGMRGTRGTIVLHRTGTGKEVTQESDSRTIERGTEVVIDLDLVTGKETGNHSTENNVAQMTGRITKIMTGAKDQIIRMRKKNQWKRKNQTLG